MTAAIMMVTYNRLELTKSTIGGLLIKTEYPFQLVIVDNGSTDGTVEWLKEWTKDLDEGFSVHIQYNKKNRGIAVGRNQALAIATKLPVEWFVTLDNDVSLPHRWLTECVEILSANRQYGGIGVNMENVQYPIVEKGGKRFQDKPRGNLGTACMVFNRSLHKMLGYFNYTDYLFYGMEDSDFGARIRVLGLKLGYIEEMGLHLGEGEYDVGKYREFKNEWHAKNLGQFNANCRDYYNRRKPLYINFVDE